MNIVRTVLFVLVAVSPAQASPLPSTIDPTQFGPPTFEERWSSLDASEMPKKPARPTRWRTVLGHGDPTVAGWRSGSGSSLYVDPQFPGVTDGRRLGMPLGLNPFEIDPGVSLTILGFRTPNDLKSKLFDRPYLGGLLTTKFSFSQLYGYFEMSAKLPVGKGLWPAFWLMPVRGSWPENGELDIVEGLGQPREIWTTVHTKVKGAGAQKKIALPFDVGGPDASWHTYGAAWTEAEIVWYVDRKEVFRAPTPPDMKQVPMYLLVNLAIGGKWGGMPDASTSFPARYKIQRLSVWKMP